MTEEFDNAFMVKVPSPSLLGLSKENGVWGVSEAFAQALSEAKGKVALIFSISMSGHFQGCALVEGGVGEQSWADFDRVVQVRWVHACDLPFGEAKHLKNANGKGVQTTKHGQEIEAKACAELWKLFHTKAGGKTCDAPTKPVKVKPIEASGKRGRADPEVGASKAPKDGKASKHLCEMNYGDYVDLFDRFKSISRKLETLGGGRSPDTTIQEILESLSASEREDIHKSLSKDDFMDVCQVICNMNGVNFSRRERALVDFYDAIR